MLGIFLGHFPTLFTEAEALSPTQGPPSAVVLHSASFGDPLSLPPKAGIKGCPSQLPPM